MMRILYIANLYPSEKHQYFGTFVKEIFNGLSQHYYIKKVVKRKVSRFLIVPSYLGYCIMVWFNISLYNFDMIFVQYGNHSLLPLVFSLNGLLRSSVVINLHGSDMFPEKWTAKIIRGIVYRVLRNCRAYVVPSEYFKKELLQQDFYCGQPIIVSPSGGVEFQYAESKSNRDKVSTHHINVSFLGRLEEDKGILKFVDFIKETSATNEYKFHIAGEGSKRKIIEEVCAVEVDSKYWGPLAQHEVYSFLHNMDVMLFLSERKSESLGLVLVEALSCSTLVIALRNGAVSEVIEHGVNGYIIESYDALHVDHLIKTHFSKSIVELSQFEEQMSHSVKRFERDNVLRDLAVELQRVIQN